MFVPTFSDWLYTVDREATVLAYGQVERGGADVCNCGGCRNFKLARPRVYPSEFLTLLERLGIDPQKEAEAYHNGRLAPGRHHYGGWFHFVGNIEGEGDSPHVELPGFETWICPASAPRLASLRGLPVVQLEFISDSVPWLLPEPEQA